MDDVGVGQLVFLKAALKGSGRVVSKDGIVVAELDGWRENKTVEPRVVPLGN